MHGETLINAISTLWCGAHGAPRELISDGESGIVSAEQCQAFLRHQGIKLHTKAPNQHAHYIERRGKLLRDVLHKIEAQCEREDLKLPFESLLAEAVFCGNALLTVNGSTPYNAVYGRVPRVLPGLDQVTQPDDKSAHMPRTIAHAHRLREISVQAMVEGSAHARFGRAMNTRTTPSDRVLGLKCGELVDFYRVPPNKDTTGWYGPAEVINVNNASRGLFTVKYDNRFFEVQLANIRRHSVFLVFLAEPTLLSGAVCYVACSSAPRGAPQGRLGGPPRHIPCGWQVAELSQPT